MTKLNGIFRRHADLCGCVLATHGKARQGEFARGEGERRQIDVLRWLLSPVT
jgi:hypothetical protein